MAVEVPGAVPLSLPALLVNPRPLRTAAIHPSLPRKKTPAKAIASPSLVPIGKRHRRRWENAHFTDNPSVRAPTKADLLPSPPPQFPIFVPRPHAFSASVLLPSVSATAPPPSPDDSLAKGMFTLSLTGVKRGLRATVSPPEGPIASFLLSTEAELVRWLTATAGAAFSSTSRVLLRDPATTEPTLIELSRLPHTLRWIVPDGFKRFLVHCLARHYNLSSFSAPLPGGTDGERVTHVVRNSIAKPRMAVGAALETPPGTDLSASEVEESDQSDWEQVEREEVIDEEDEDFLLPASPTPTKPSSSPAFVNVTPLSHYPLASPTPTQRRPTRAFFPPRSLAATRDDGSVSPSRSPVRLAQTPAQAGMRSGEWKMPESTFMEFLSS